MRTVRLTQDGLILRETGRPACGPDEVLVRTAGCGVCEGDVFHYRSRLGTQPPFEVDIGHEGSGIVEQVGANVEGLVPGDAVTALCGNYAEFFVAPPTSLVKLPPAVAPVRALGEPLACCVHAAWRFGIRLGDRVAILGCGFMGLVCLQLARLMGAAHVAAFDLLSWRLDVARSLGADETANSDRLAPAEATERYGEFDVVIEAAGSDSVIDLATALIRQHGTLSLVGYHQSNGGRRNVPMQVWNFKAITVVNGHVRREDEKLAAAKAAMDLLASGRLTLDPLVTDYPLADANRAFADLVGRKPGLFKANLVP